MASPSAERPERGLHDGKLLPRARNAHSIALSELPGPGFVIGELLMVFRHL